MRLFLALYPPKEYLDYFRDVVRKFAKQKRNLKVIPTDQLHVTLKYIGGKVHDSSYELIREELLLHQGSFGAVDVQLGETVFGFPHEKFPKILLSKVKSTKSIVEASNSIHSIVQSLKLRDTIKRKNRYANSFHVSIARLKDNSQKSTAKLLVSSTKNINIPKPEPVVLDEMYLVESIVTHKGPVYKKLDRIRL